MLVFTVMLLYPFLILLVGFVAALFCARILRNHVCALLVSFLAASSSFMVLLVFLSFTKPILLRFWSGTLTFEFNLLNMFLCLLAVGVSLIFFGVRFFSVGDGESAFGVPATAFMLFSAVGSVISTSVYGFMLFYEVAFMSFFVLISGSRKNDPFSLFDYVVYFFPTALIVLAALWLCTAGAVPWQISELPMNRLLRVIFAAAFFLRLFLFPLSFSLQRLTRTVSIPETGCGIVIASITAWSGLIKFCRADASFAFIIAVVAVFAMAILVIQVFRQRTIEDAVIFACGLQGGFVTGAVALSGLNNFAGSAMGWIILNHVLSASGLLIWSIMSRSSRERPDVVVYTALVMCLIGLFPCPGFAGRWLFLQSHLLSGSTFVLPAILLLLLSLSPIYPLAKRLREMLKHSKPAAVCKISPLSKAFAVAIAVAFIGPLLFINPLNRFFLGLMR